MKMRELAQEWLPEVAPRAGTIPITESDDEVVRDDIRARGNHLRIKVRKKDGMEYAATLVIPNTYLNVR